MFLDPDKSQVLKRELQHRMQVIKVMSLGLVRQVMLELNISNKVRWMLPHTRIRVRLQLRNRKEIMR